MPQLHLQWQKALERWPYLDHHQKLDEIHYLSMFFGIPPSGVAFTLMKLKG